MASKKSASAREHAIDRVGVSWRRNPLTGERSKCVVEMRPPGWVWKLNFGSYGTEAEAMVARDYGALLRVSALEDGATAGGFIAYDHPSICKFEESHVIFEDMDVFKIRCDEYKRLLTLYHQQPKEKCGANSPYKQFCKEARSDIAIAIEEFRTRYSHKFVDDRPATEATKGFQLVDGGTHFTPPSSSFEGGSSQSSRSSLMVENKQDMTEYPGGNFLPGIAAFNNSLSSRDGKQCQVIRGFHGDSMFDGRSQETSPWTKENSKYKTKKDSKSLLQMELNSLEPCHDGSKMQDNGASRGGVSRSPGSSYEGYNMQLGSFQSVMTPNGDQRMSPTSITYSGAPGSLSEGTSVDDETGLSSYNRRNCRQEMAQIEEQFTEGGVADHDTNHVFECHLKNDDQNVMLDNHQWWDDTMLLNDDGDEYFEDQTAMDIDEMVNMDIPIQSSVTIPHESDSTSEFDRASNATTPNPTSQVETVMSKVEVTEKVESKVASNKVMSKAEMVENRFKSSTLSTHDYSALSALLAAQLESERVELDTRVQKNKAAKLANLQTAKDGGGISLREYKQQVKALLNL